jgi:predicted alpha/beta-hydrolase family hydrolase
LLLSKFPDSHRQTRALEMTTRDLEILVSDTIGSVSAILVRPDDAWLLYAVAHGAGANMRHRFLHAISDTLASRGIATLRYQFPYTEAGRKRPDSPAVLEATVRGAVAKAAELAPELPLIAGGKSLGGRMTSGAAAKGMLPHVRGLVFLGFPLHPPGQPGTERADHLDAVDVPLLFLQGTRDPFARLDLLNDLCSRLPRASLHLIPDGDHSFGVPKRSGRTSSDVMDELGSTIAEWARAQVLGTVSA